MHRHCAIPAIVLITMGIGLSLLFSGCGSAGIDHYEQEIAELNGATADALEETSHLPGEEELADDAERAEAAISVLEEDIELLNEALRELEAVKVPEGMEDFHRELMAFYRADLLTCEELKVTLEPGEEQAEGEETGHGEEESAEPQEEELPQGEEKPAEGPGH